MPWGVVGVIGPWNYPLTMATSDGLWLVAGNAIMLSLTRPAGRGSGGTGALDRPASRSVAGRARPRRCRRRELIDVSDYVCHRVDRHRTPGRGSVCQPPDGCPGARRQNPMVVRTTQISTQRGRGTGLFLQRRPTLCIDERIYVTEPHQPFVRAFVSVRRQSGRKRPDFEHDMGSLVNRPVGAGSAHVEDARAKGAMVVTGGRRRGLGDLFYEPTILTDVTPGVDCYAEETFGPVVASASRAPRRTRWQSQRLHYGLNASVWTADHDRGRRVARSNGTVNINEGLCRHLQQHRRADGRDEELRSRTTRGRTVSDGLSRFSRWLPKRNPDRS